MRAYDPNDVNVIVGGVALTGFAEDTFVQAERMGNTLLAREEQTEAQRVAAEQYDSEGMVRAISQMQTQQTAVSAALQSYASIQKLSLLNYIS